ncbi:MAG: hypothetical protein M9890_04640 [Thermomicrobiales bacterium]|nr:hypothetical protein [Thermomicrobiales bacterium]
MYDPSELPKTVERTHTAARQAAALLDGVQPVERALIEALQQRYQSDTPVEDFTSWTDDYAAAMRAVYAAYPDDLDVAALTAEALMNRTPWALWDLASGDVAEGADTNEARAILERALETSECRVHPGVLHMYIHLMEMSPFPELALRAGDWLRDLVPDAGHLRHMPTHIDVLCGHYYQVVASNHDAVIADEKYREREGAMNFYTLYRVHNFHFKLYGAMFIGQSEIALRTADEVVETIPLELLQMEAPPMADWLEGFMAVKMHVLIRFGRWQEIIDAPLPDDPELFCTTTALYHYAKGVAFSATGQVAEAEEQQRLFHDAVARVPETRTLFNNTCQDILAIAAEMLAGELEYRRGNYDVAYAHLRRSIELEDGLVYDEPWGWMQPTRHAYGALLLEQGHVEEAEAVYCADLGLDGSLPRAYQHPENVWSLHGYHECLVRQGKHALAAMIRQRLDLAAARADIPIRASCYCRMTHAA